MTADAAPFADAAPCPCGSGERYRQCCGRLHHGDAVASTAEQLMRSRYSAFAVGDARYLLQTWHPSTRPRELQLDPGIEWRRLDVLDTVDGGETDASGEVEFRAYWRALPVPGVPRDGGVQRERSRFVREHGRWFYVDGDTG